MKLPRYSRRHVSDASVVSDVNDDGDDSSFDVFDPREVAVDLEQVFGEYLAAETKALVSRKPAIKITKLSGNEPKLPVPRVKVVFRKTKSSKEKCSRMEIEGRQFGNLAKISTSLEAGHIGQIVAGNLA